jgi:hypothetical protein
MLTRITVYAGPSGEDPRESSVAFQVVANSDVSEHLRMLGLEWRTADYMPQRQVVITLDPIEPEHRKEDVKIQVRAAAEALERTGLL